MRCDAAISLRRARAANLVLRQLTAQEAMLGVLRRGMLLGLLIFVGRRLWLRRDETKTGGRWSMVELYRFHCYISLFCRRYDGGYAEHSRQ